MKITEAELNTEIGKRCGWTQSEKLVGPGNVPVWLDPDGDESLEAPPYSSDMNLAVELLAELPDASLEKLTFEYHGVNGWSAGWNEYGGGITRDWRECSKPGIAICLAWLQYKTGEVYEVIE